VSSRHPGASVRSTVAAWLAAFAVYAAIAIAFTWPLAAHLGTAFPHDPFDPALTTWILWWNAHAMPLTMRWWNAPMFWPLPEALGLSEHLLGVSVLTTPLQWAGSSPIASANIAVLLSFSLSAIAAHALAFAVTRRHDAGVVAALVFGFSPYRTSHLPHVQMLWTFGIPLTLAGAHGFAATLRRRWLALFAAGWLLLALSNGYAMVFSPVLFACWILWFARDRARFLPLILVWVVASLPLVPIVLGYQRVHERLGLRRTPNEIANFSADLTALFAAPQWLLLWGGLSKWSRPEGELFPGALALALVVAGAAAGVRRLARAGIDRPPLVRTAWVVLTTAALGVLAIAISPAIVGPWHVGSVISVSSSAKPLTLALVLGVLSAIATRSFRTAWQQRSAGAFYTGAAVLMFLLALGPYPTLSGHRVLYRAPYAWLMELPGYSSVRAPARFAMLFIPCVAIAAACAFASLTAKRSPRVRLIAGAAAAVTILAESWPAVSVAPTPGPVAVLGSAAREAATVELPIGLVDRDTAALYRSIDHQRVLVNGYSGYTPPHYVILEIALRDEDLDALAELSRGEPLLVAIDRRFQFARWAEALTARQAPLVADDGASSLYRLTGAPAARALSGERLPIQSVEASVASDGVARMLDGDWSTAWTTQGPQQQGESVIIDLGREREVAGVRLDFGPRVGDVPRRLTVECAAEHGEWQTCWRGSALAAAVRGALDDPLRVPMPLPIGRPGVRRLRLRELADDTDRPWSIAELIVHGR
jgi:hypothetical protein